MSTHVRRARADDAKLLAVTDLLALRSHVNWGAYDLLFTSEQLRLRFLELVTTAEPPTFAHYTCFFVAEVDGKPAGALCGFTEGERVTELWREVKTSTRRTMGISDEEWAEAEARAAPAMACNYVAATGSWVTEWVGVLPEFRRRGVINALLETILDEGRRTGHTVAEIAVLIGNEPAQRAYEKAGFVAFEDVFNLDFERAMRAPGVRKLKQTL